MNYKFTPCTDEEAEFIDDSLVEFNLSKVPPTQEDFISFNTKVTDDDGNVIAGCLAGMYFWNVVYIDILWVDERYRKKGLGSALLKEVERKAKEEGGYIVHLDTFDWQAKEFYEKNGYTVFGTLENCPKDHNRYYMTKTI